MFRGRVSLRIHHNDKPPVTIKHQAAYLLCISNLISAGFQWPAYRGLASEIGPRHEASKI
uniref:Uncharacterized protein n=1 Tax=feces metagenome TaxID=1861841 RepID=A0A7M2QP33_9ZZZZ